MTDLPSSNPNLSALISKGHIHSGHLLGEAVISVGLPLRSAVWWHLKDAGLEGTPRIILGLGKPVDVALAVSNGKASGCIVGKDAKTPAPVATFQAADDHDDVDRVLGHSEHLLGLGDQAWDGAVGGVALELLAFLAPPTVDPVLIAPLVLVDPLATLFGEGERIGETRTAAAMETGGGAVASVLALSGHSGHLLGLGWAQLIDGDPEMLEQVAGFSFVRLGAVDQTQDLRCIALVAGGDQPLHEAEALHRLALSHSGHLLGLGNQAKHRTVGLVSVRCGSPTLRAARVAATLVRLDPLATLFGEGARFGKVIENPLDFRDIHPDHTIAGAVMSGPILKPLQLRSIYLSHSEHLLEAKFNGCDAERRGDAFAVPSGWGDSPTLPSAEGAGGQPQEPVHRQLAQTFGLPRLLDGHGMSIPQGLTDACGILYSPCSDRGEADTSPGLIDHQLSGDGRR